MKLIILIKAGDIDRIHQIDITNWQEAIDKLKEWRDKLKQQGRLKDLKVIAVSVNL